MKPSCSLNVCVPLWISNHAENKSHKLCWRSKPKTNPMINSIIQLDQAIPITSYSIFSKVNWINIFVLSKTVFSCLHKDYSETAKSSRGDHKLRLVWKHYWKVLRSQHIWRVSLWRILDKERQKPAVDWVWDICDL